MSSKGQFRDLYWGTVRRALVFCLLLTLQVISAQDDEIPRLDYGETISGEISDASPQQVYQFEGTAGEIVAIEMISVDRALDNKLSEPVLMLRSPSAETIVDTTLRFDVDDTLLVAHLPEDGTYYVIATRDPNVVILAEGEFSLTVHNVEILSVGDSRSSTIQEVEFGQYFAVDTDGLPWLLSYERLSGDYSPQITVNLLNPERGGVELIAASYGTKLTQTRLGVFEPGEVYFIWIKAHPDAFTFGENDADYQISVRQFDVPG